MSAYSIVKKVAKTTTKNAKPVIKKTVKKADNGIGVSECGRDIKKGWNKFVTWISKDDDNNE